MGHALREGDTARTIIAAAHELAERHGLKVASAIIEDDALVIALEGTSVEAMGLAAELRRLTERWYQAKFGASLWGKAP